MCCVYCHDSSAPAPLYRSSAALTAILFFSYFLSLLSPALLSLRSATERTSSGRTVGAFSLNDSHGGKQRDKVQRCACIVS
mmetsp:Transcript_5858/g.12774  ORF Transcript_5858/g.12774 Transcript_5858/m.12774 type:complete len:81 (-) Transcript_5858:459-701(-)